jgi:hypothetical protein
MVAMNPFQAVSWAIKTTVSLPLQQQDVCGQNHQDIGKATS